MKTTFISTKAISEATRLSMIKAQARLVDAQKELASGRLADVGKSLGYKAGETVLLRQEHTRLTALMDTNGQVSSRLDLALVSLQGMVEGAQELVSQLIGARSSQSGPAVIQQYANNGLQDLVEALNASFNGSYLFSGINTDVKPVADYLQSPPGAAQQAVATAFQTAFGVPQSNPATGSITAADMQTFLDGAFANLFDAPDWSTNWSAASDQDVKSRISTYELLESGTNANEAAFRQLASALTMAADLGVESLNPGAYEVVINQAIELAGQALQELSKLQAKLGMVQERVAKANERMSLQIDILSAHIGTLEGVDPYEASTRVTALTTQIETAYALTARLQKLSLLNYL